MQENTGTSRLAWFVCCRRDAAASHEQQTGIIVPSHQRFWGHLYFHLHSLSITFWAGFQKLITSMTLKRKTNIKGRRCISEQRRVNIEIWVCRRSEGQSGAVVLSHHHYYLPIRTHCTHTHSDWHPSLQFSCLSLRLFSFCFFYFCTPFTIPSFSLALCLLSSPSVLCYPPPSTPPAPVLWFWSQVKE